MSRYKSIISSILLSFFCSPIHAYTTIVHTDNLLDFQALTSNQGDGNFSASTNLLALSEVYPTVKFEYMTAMRTLRFMNKGESICTVNKIKTKEREHKYLFSQPVNLYLGQRLYTKVTNASPQKSAGPNDSVSLVEVFTKEPDEKLLITDQVSYGDSLDTQILAIPTKNKFIRNGQGHETGLMEMFMKDRAKYVLLYPQQVFDYMAKQKVNSFAVEGTTSFILGHLMCTKTSDSADFILKVNQHLSNPDTIETLKSIHLKFIKPSDKSTLEHYFHQVF